MLLIVINIVVKEGLVIEVDLFFRLIVILVIFDIIEVVVIVSIVVIFNIFFGILFFYQLIQLKDFYYYYFFDMEIFLRRFVNEYFNIIWFYLLGKLVELREFYVMEIFDNLGVYELGELEFKYIGNMYGNEVVGRELLLNFIEYFCKNFGIDFEVIDLVYSIRIYFMLFMNFDGYEKFQEGDLISVIGRNNSNNFDLN